MSTFGLTARQRQLLGFITDCIRDRGSPPTVREMVARIGGGMGNVHRMICQLEERGAIVRLPNMARTISVPGLECGRLILSDAASSVVRARAAAAGLTPENLILSSIPVPARGAQHG